MRAPPVQGAASQSGIRRNAFEVQVSGKTCLPAILPDGSPTLFHSGTWGSPRPPPSVRRQLLPFRRPAGCTFSSALGAPFQATGKAYLRRKPSHIGSVFTFGSRRANTNDERTLRSHGQRILSSCRTIPAIWRNLSFFRCFRAIRARAVSSGSWV